jgi:hypothetical protein
MRFRWSACLVASCLLICNTASAEVPNDLARAQWRVRDVAKGTDFESGDALQLNLRADHTPAADVFSSACTVTDATGGERAVTLALCIPLDATGGTWWDDPQRSRPIAGGKLFANLSDRSGGVDNAASLYPLAVIVTRDGRAIAVACPPDHPRLPRFVYDPANKELRAEFDFGLSPVVEAYPSRADAKVVAFEVPAKWAFRQALARYYALYPEPFKRRVKTAGIWLPFDESGPVANAADFGFAFHEVADHQVTGPSAERIMRDDERIGCGSYVYTEPQSYWQQYAGDGKGTYEQRLAQLEREAKDGSPVARATLVSGAIRHDGRREIYIDDVAYTPQRPWGSNADPNVTDPDGARNWPGKGRYEMDRLESMLGWLDKPDVGVDGVYVDSMEGWGEVLNYNRDHWRVSKYPLTFDPRTKKPALLNFWGTVEFVKRIAEKSRERGMVLFGNDAFYRRWQLAPWVDVPGREYAWIEDGKFKPVEDSRYLFFRAMSGRKPYLMLMNNRYEDGSMMEPYFQRSLFYAVFPSMFIGHAGMNEQSYFSNPAWYNRDRHLFKKYVPLIRKLDEAGWEPVPHASVDVETVRIERYGSAERNNLAITLHNTTDQPQRVTLTLEPELAVPAGAAATEWIREKPLTVSRADDRATVHVEVPALGYASIGFAPGVE